MNLGILTLLVRRELICFFVRLSFFTNWRAGRGVEGEYLTNAELRWGKWGNRKRWRIRVILFGAYVGRADILNARAKSQ